MEDKNQPISHSPDADSCRVCVIIPTFNNADKLGDIIEGVKEHVESVIVVNDGSMDATEQVICRFPEIYAILFGENRGKGCALQAGMHMARAQGFTHAISFDSDGGHDPDDIPHLIDAVKKEPQTLWIGNRVKTQQKNKRPLPAGLFGKAGGLWYRFNTGYSVHDIFCGMRAYPLKELKNLKLHGCRYEFEQDVLIRAAWNGTSVKELKINYLNESGTSGAGHFHPINDSAKIAGVYVKAALIRVFLPVMSFEVPGNNLKQKIVHVVKQELKSHASPLKASLSLSLGVFMGIFPIHGLQVVTLMGLATVFRLNRPLSFLGVCVSSPPLLPLIIVAAVAVGKFILSPSMLSLNASVGGPPLFQGAAEFVVGSVILAFFCSVATFFSVFPILRKISSYRITRSKD